MTSKPSLNREEQALEEFLQSATGLVAVCVTDPFHPGSQLMADRLQALAESERGLRAVAVGLEGYRSWARRHRIAGTPCIAVFRGGLLIRRLNGILTEEDLYERLTSGRQHQGAHPGAGL
ncbi:MAG: Thioredoxin [Candidatus Sumerlaeota bacterium]|nr:Thioredoxin [Candidatus Sumerlaeota bacterium]